MPAFTNSPFPVVVHSHLRWSGIWQRPQQLHSRIARERAVTFIEEPLASAGPPRLELHTPAANLVVVQPHVPRGILDAPATCEAVVVALLREAAQRELSDRVRNAVHWLYTPMMEPQIAALGAASGVVGVVYDCMDELTQFLHAPAALASRERRLLSRADVVFTGGAALYDAKRRHHQNVHLFGCGVDFDHFHRAASMTPHPDVRTIPGPRLGYVGAIDERLDYELLAEIARRQPTWSLVLVGPVVKIDPDALPNGRNVHLLGPRGYAELPSLLAGFDVCLMPFALNAATEFINPTKTLEYLATGRPVASTPVRDVVRLFGDVVSIAPADRFIAVLAELLQRGARAREAGLERARHASWESIVHAMTSLVDAAVSSNGRASVHAVLAGAAARDLSREAQDAL